ncbi:MAG: hydrogenase formation protein HypD [Candidatus Aminicenantes bacterium]|nr:hydrogenase formation protein HypD [Acidobacteriota bacterium]MCG2812952.1 hydrogenase formation protein HypD [Candidatus Aminicenantes bacterium]
MAEASALPRLAERLRSFPARPGTKIMEVCGTHTVAIRRSGLQHLLPAGVKLVSGPGCPVCVTPDRFIDEAVALARQGVVITSFGDMLRVPGSRSSLEKERAAGADIRAVYSPLDALKIADESGKETVFLAVGFETTAPAIAAAAMKALEKKIANFSMLTALRLVPPALQALIAGDTGLSGFLLPGHVSAIIGKQAYDFLLERRLPGVISGFTAEDIISSLLLLLEMNNKDIYKVMNNYPRVVRDNGNEKSRTVLAEVFEPVDAEWRGLGAIPASGLQLKPAFASLDSRRRFAIPNETVRPRRGCRCGDVLRGLIDPPACPLFNKACRPDRPLGPCMVSSEGSCSAWVTYG